MSEKSIKVTIAGRIYPISVKPEEEEGVRHAAKRVDESVKHLQDNYAVKDKQDLLAMTALQLSTKLAEAEAIVAKGGSVDEVGLIEIEELLDDLL
ncbi:MAG: cell division protein ZapA [Flavobacteriales bacterium]|nr:cell division protein ZapA [Flavobacteriales bacterium]